MVSFFKTLKLCTGLGSNAGKAKPPSFTIGTVTKPIEPLVSTIQHTTPSFTIGAKRVEQATQEMTGATQLAEQNRTFIIGNRRPLINGYSELSDPAHPRLTSDMNTLEPLQNIEAFCKNFKTRTGLELHIPDNHNLSTTGMNEIADFILMGMNKGTFPTDIKHVVMSHGRGLSTNGTWVFFNNGQSVPQWINTHITRGEKCLVAVCETGSTSLNKARPGIGNTVQNSFNVPEQPAKLMRSGDNNIIGHYLRDTGATYY